MATTRKTTEKKPGTAVASWDEELAKYAEQSVKQEANTNGGKFFGLKTGQLTFDGEPVLGNRMACIIVDSVLENVYYEGGYDADVPQAPTCYAFGRDEATMTPHQKVWDKGNQQCGASKLCQGCQWNEYGTAEKGKGKACRNTRRLAIIVAGSYDKKGELTLIEDEDHFNTSALAFMKLPVTSTKGFAAYVKQLGTVMKRPPFAMITEVSVVPDAKSQFKVLFEAIGPVPDELIATMIKRNKEAVGVIDFPYGDVDEEKKPAKSKGAQKPAAGKPARRKY